MNKDKELVKAYETAIFSSLLLSGMLAGSTNKLQKAIWNRNWN